MRLNLTQHGKPYQVRTQSGLTDCELFLDSVDGGAWPLLVRGIVCLVNFVNERDLYLPIDPSLVFVGEGTCLLARVARFVQPERAGMLLQGAVCQQSTLK